MHVGYVGNFRHSFCTEVHVKCSLEELGHRVTPLQEDGVNWVALPRLARSRRFDLLLWTRTWSTDGRRALTALAEIQRHGIHTASFHLDRWWGLDREYQVMSEPFFRTELVVTADGGHEFEWGRVGVNHRWLPPGVFGAECVQRAPRPDRFPHDIVFVGSHPYPHKEWAQHRTAMIERIERRYRGRFKVWPERGRPLRGEELGILYASAKIVLGDSCLAGSQERYWSDRIPETLGRGGFLIHPDVRGLDEWYRNGVELVTYPLDDLDTLEALVEHYLNHEDERRAIAEQGRATTLARDTYVHRMSTLLEWVTNPEKETAIVTFPPAPASITTSPPSRPRVDLTGKPSRSKPPSERATGCDDCARVPSVSCVVCGGTLDHVLCLGNAPVANRLRDSEDEPVERFPLHVARCSECTTVQLVSRPPAETLFGVDYPYRSSQSRTMLASAAHLAEYLTRSLSLGADDVVMEVGSNDGYLLRHYMRRGVQVLGFDPAESAAADAQQIGVTTETVFFDRKLGAAHAGEASIVHANNVLAHVDDPDDIVAGIAEMLRPDGLLVVETPWLAALIDAGAFDTIYHEHRFYWSADALARLLSRHNLHVVHIEHLHDLHGGTLRVFARKGSGWSLELWHTLSLEQAAGLADRHWGERFEIIHRGQVEQLRRWWEGMEPIAGYGAAAKATVLLHVLDVRGPLWVVDSTPAKQGKWTPCGSLVLPPIELERRMPPDCVIFPWNFAREIAGKAQPYVEAGGRLWTLIPRVERVA